MNSEQLLRSNEGSKGKDNSNEIVRNVWEESTNGKSVSNQKADTSKDERDMVISSNDYEIGEPSEICQPSIVLGSEKSNYDMYSFASSEDLSDFDICVPKKPILPNHQWYIANQERLESCCLLK